MFIRLNGVRGRLINPARGRVHSDRSENKPIRIPYFDEMVLGYADHTNDREIVRSDLIHACSFKRD
jgi:hypothetical protein